MDAGVVGVFVPIVLFLVTGLVLIAFYYFRYRERQMLIEKGLSSEEIKEFFKNRRNPYFLLAFGIICVFFGISLGIGFLINDTTGKDYYIAVSLFIGTGIGFGVANLVSKRLNAKEPK